MITYPIDCNAYLADGVSAIICYRQHQEDRYRDRLVSSADSSKRRTTARVIGKLTTVLVRQARHRGLYGDGGGLFLQVSRSGAKSWVFRFKEGHRLRVMGLGPVHTIS